MYQLINLEYLFHEMEPYIDIHTMGLHYYKHYKNYLNYENDRGKYIDNFFEIADFSNANKIFNSIVK